MEPLNLKKGEMLDLTKASETPLKKISLGAGWDMADEGVSIDIDLSAAVMKGGKYDTMCYFGTKSVYNGAVESMGDNLTGEGDGDDETINVDLEALPADVDSVVFILNIYDAKAKGQFFSGVQNAFIRAYNTETNQELAKTEVSTTTDSYDHLIFAKVVRNGDAWEFTSLQEYGNGDLNAVVAKLS